MKKCVYFFKLRYTAYIYIFVCTDKQWQLFDCLTELHVISLKVKRSFSWYYCFSLAIYQQHVNKIVVNPFSYGLEHYWLT